MSPPYDEFTVHKVRREFRKRWTAMPLPERTKVLATTRMRFELADCCIEAGFGRDRYYIEWLSAIGRLPHNIADYIDGRMEIPSQTLDEYSLMLGIDPTWIRYGGEPTSATR